MADVAAEEGPSARGDEAVVDRARGGGLALGAGDGHDGRLRQAEEEGEVGLDGGRCREEGRVGPDRGVLDDEVGALEVGHARAGRGHSVWAGPRGRPCSREGLLVLHVGDGHLGALRRRGSARCSRPPPLRPRPMTVTLRPRSPAVSRLRA